MMQKKTRSYQQTEDKILRKTGVVESALGKMGAMADGAVDRAWSAPGRAINSTKAKAKQTRIRVSRKARDVAEDLSIRLDPDRTLPETADDEERDKSSPSL
jgi:hypothetical protein